MTRLKLAELTSGIGALGLGVGLGALFARFVGPAAWVATLTGVLVHAFGMWDKHHLERKNAGSSGSMVIALYWVCWVMLTGVLVFLIV